MKMKKFVIKVDLSAFFADERKMSMILVEPEWTTVKSLQQKLRSLFDLKSLHFLTMDGCYIALEESIEVLRFVDCVKAFLTKPEVAKTKKRKSGTATGKVSETLQLTKCSKNREEIAPAVLHTQINNEENIQPASKTEKEPSLIKFDCLLEKQSLSKARIFNVTTVTK